jgi:hypothetical protein
MAPSIRQCVFIRAAAKDGAELIQLPELVTLFEPDNDLVLQKACGGHRPRRRGVSRPGRETGAWIVVGSSCLKETGADKIVNRCLVIDPPAASSRATTRSICSMSISPMANLPESATVRAATGQSWHPRPGACWA